MSVTHVLEYPSDIIDGIGDEPLELARRIFESKGWKAISWGVDSHDAIEFTIYRQHEEHEIYISLYLAIAGDREIKYALEALIDRSGHGRKVSIESGALRTFGVDDLERLLNRGIERKNEVDGLKAPLIAAVGAADLALERVNEIVATLRERSGEARSDAEARVEESRARLTKLQEDLPVQFSELRRRLTSEELRKFAESYAESVQIAYATMVQRGEAALERLRNPLVHGESADEDVSDVLAKLEQSVKARRQTPDAEWDIKKAPAKKTPAKKVVKKAVKKAPAKKLARQAPKRRG